MTSNPKLEDLINAWRENTDFSDWSYTKAAGHPQSIHACGYLYPPSWNKNGLVQVWTDHVIVIISPDTISVFQASEHYRRYLKEMVPPGSNQWIRIEAADPEFFDVLGESMKKINDFRPDVQ